MPLSDIECLTALEALDARDSLPMDCDTAAFVDEGFVVEFEGRWQLTVKGRLYLANLRSLQRQQLKDLPQG